jgi:hypothetical protein
MSWKDMWPVDLQPRDSTEIQWRDSYLSLHLILVIANITHALPTCNNACMLLYHTLYTTLLSVAISYSPTYAGNLKYSKLPSKYTMLNFQQAGTENPAKSEHWKSHKRALKILQASTENPTSEHWKSYKRALKILQASTENPTSEHW